MIYGSSLPVLHTVIGLIRRRKCLIAATTILALATAGLTTYFRPVDYRGQTSLILKFGREYDYRPEVGEMNRFVPFSVEEAVNAEVQILNSRDLKEHVINEVGMGRIAPWVWHRSLPAQLIDFGIKMQNKFEIFEFDRIGKIFRKARYRLTEDKMSAMDRATKNLTRMLTINTTEKSPIIHIYFDHYDRDVATEALGALIDGFLKKRMDIFGAKRVTFLDNTMDEYRNKLDDAAKKLTEFKTKHGIVNIDEQSSLLVRHQLDLEKDIKEKDQIIRELDEQIRVIERGPAPSIAKVPIYSNEETAQIRSAAENLLNLSILEEQQLAKYLEGTRPVQDVRAQMAKVKQFLEEQRRIGAGRLRLEKRAAEASRQDLEQQLHDVRADLARFDNLRSDVRELERDVARYERDYQTYAVKAEEERISRALDEERVSNVRVVQTPISLPEPVGIPPGMKTLIGGLLGFLAGIGLAFLAEFRRNRPATAERMGDVLHLPVLAVIPDLQSPQQ